MPARRNTSLFKSLCLKPLLCEGTAEKYCSAFGLYGGGVVCQESKLFFRVIAGVIKLHIMNLSG